MGTAAHAQAPRRRVACRVGRSGVVVLALLLAMLAPATTMAATQYWFPGKGWGHGIGMSQYGAQGFAGRGFTAEQVIRYYFNGVSVDDAAGNPTFRVLLVEGRSELEVVARGGNVTVTRNGASSSDVDAGDVLRIRRGGAGTCVLRIRDGATSTLLGCGAGTVVVTGAVATRFTADNGAFGHRYRGHLRFVPHGAGLRAVNHVPLELYLRGVVPSEMPASWHAEALGAQAIAARSYALATRRSGPFDAFADTRSQVYRGIEHEHSRTTAAVNATRGLIATVGGQVVPTFYHSTSGGRTANIEHVWNSEPRSYLRGRPDPWERSPHSSWDIREVRFGPAHIRRQLGAASAPGAIRDIRVQVNGSGRVQQARIVTARGTRTIPGTQVREALGLRSTFFRVERLEIRARARQVRRGQRVAIEGTVPRSGATFLVFRPRSGGRWQRVGRVRPQRGTRYRVNVRPQQDGVYRLQRRGQLGPGVRIRVR